MQLLAWLLGPVQAAGGTWYVQACLPSSPLQQHWALYFVFLDFYLFLEREKNININVREEH